MRRYRAGTPQPNLPRRTLDYLEHGAPEGQRNQALFDAACQFRDAGIAQQDAEPRLLARALRDGLGQIEAVHTIKSVYEQSPREPACPNGSPSLPAIAPTGPLRQAAPRATPPPAPVSLPAPIEGGFQRLLDACFRPEEFVSIAPAHETDDGEIAPSKGVTFTATDWKSRVEAKGGIERCFSTKLGLFIRINPVTSGGSRNDDVTSFRHVLVEFDTDREGKVIPKEAQFGAVVASGLPVSALIDSGNKSLHAWIRVDAKDARQYRERVETIWKRLEGLDLDTKNKNPSRLSRCPDGRRTVDGEVRVQRLLAIGLGAKSWDEWEKGNAANGLPEIESGTEFMAWHAPPPPDLIRGVLPQGLKMILGGVSKARKSWSLIDMMLSVATGTPWWDFQTQPSRVLYLNFELPRYAFHHRLKVIGRAKGISDFRGVDVWNLRGYAADLSVLMPKILAKIQDRSYGLVILDPIYKSLGNRDENKAGDIASLCNEIEQLAVKADAAVVFGAHFAKGSYAEKDAMDRIGGSGVFARDPDVLFAMTPHETKDCYVVDSRLRVLPQIDPFVVRWEYPVFVRDQAGDPTLVKGSNKRPARVPGEPTYRAAKNWKLYGHHFGSMPPKHNQQPRECSEVLAHIVEVMAKHGDEIDLNRAQKIFDRMRMGETAVLVFDPALRVWKGREFKEAS